MQGKKGQGISSILLTVVQRSREQAIEKSLFIGGKAFQRTGVYLLLKRGCDRFKLSTSPGKKNSLYTLIAGIRFALYQPLPCHALYQTSDGCALQTEQLL
jgi:hypothetical protein